MDKAEATALALGIAKLMKMKPGETIADETSGEIVSKHLDADFSCFLCLLIVSKIKLIALSFSFLSLNLGSNPNSNIV